MDSDDFDTVCDRCAAPMLASEGNHIQSGEWTHCTICNECAGELSRTGNPDGTDLVTGK